MATHEIYFREHWSSFQEVDLLWPRPNPTFGNPGFHEASLRVLIVRLSPFRDVVRSTPHLFLFQAVRRAIADAYIDIAFFPASHDRERWLRDGIPLLIGTQSWHDVADFDLVLISNSYTLELLNLPYLMLHSGMPLLASQRGEAWPPMVLGGSNAMACQAVVSPDGDSFVDALFFGEGEREVERFLRTFYRHNGLPKADRLRSAAQAVPSMWLANLDVPQRLVKAVCRDPDARDLIVDYPDLNSDEASTARLQVTFGCPAFCSFCFEGYDRKPYREVPLTDVLAVAKTLKRQHGVEAVDVYSFNFNTYAPIFSMLLGLHRYFDRVGLTSQRVDILAAFPRLLDAETTAEKRSFTLGIEGISRRMRAFLHKSLTEGEIKSVIARLLRGRVRELKLFFILTGHETGEDLAEFHRFVGWLKAQQRMQGGVPRVIFSFGLLIRMPFTPLQYDRLMLEEEPWRPLVGAAKSSCETQGFEFRLAMPWDAYAVTQVLAIGGHWLIEALRELASEGRCYDRALTPGTWERLRAWLVSHGYWTSDLLDEKGPDWEPPLASKVSHVPSRFLYTQYQRAKAGEDVGYCLGEVGDKTSLGEAARCLGCGACIEREERERLTHHTMQSPLTGYLEQLARVVEVKRRVQPLYFVFWLPPLIARARTAWLNAMVMRGLIAAWPELVSVLYSARESLFRVRQHAGRYPGLYGKTVVALRTTDIERVREVLAGGGLLDQNVRVLESVEGFTPGQFVRANLHVRLPRARFPKVRDRLVEYLRSQYIPVNLRRSDFGYALDLPSRALRKRVILEGHVLEGEEHVELRMLVTPKFDLGAFLRSFGPPGQYREAMTEVVELEL